MNINIAIQLQQLQMRARQVPMPRSATLYSAIDGQRKESVFRLDESWDGTNWLVVTDSTTTLGHDETVIVAAVPEGHPRFSDPFREVARLEGLVDHSAALETLGCTVRR